MTKNTKVYDAPLAGVRVLDLTDGEATRIGRLLADLGADIISIELDGVTGAQEEGPFVDGIPLSTRINRFGIPSVAIGRDDTSIWETELSNASILLENTPPGSAAEATLHVAAIRERHPHLVILSVSNFGRNNPFEEWQGSSPVFHALTSELSRTGKPNEAPFLPPGELPYDTAMPQAVVMLLAVYLDALRTGHGDRIDFSILEGAAAALDPAYGMAGSAAMGQSMASLPRGRIDLSHQYPIFKCRDGYVRICVLSVRQWQGMFAWMGSPEEWADPKYESLHVRFATPELNQAIGKFFLDQTRDELESGGIEYGVPTAALLSLTESLSTPQIEARGYLREVELAPGVTIPIPAGVFEIDGVRATALNIDQQTAATPKPLSAPGLRDRPRTIDMRPLEGLRVLDFGVIIVGGDTGRMLGDLGADVIKVENSAFMDGARQALTAPMAPGFASGHRNKRSIGINMRDPEGIAHAKQLVGQADIVLSNWKPGTAENLGLTYDQLKDINPGVVVVDSSAFGPTGPWSKRLGYGPLVRAAAGLSLAWADEEKPGKQRWFHDAVTVYPDHVSSRIGALAALALLVRRERTGKGGSVSVSQAEVMMGHAAASTASVLLESTGNHKLTAPLHDEPWGVFPAKGDDEWVVISVRNDRDWNALTAELNLTELTNDTAFSTPEGRVEHHQRIRQIVATYTQSHNPKEIMERLQGVGVPAGWMLRGVDLPTFGAYSSRNAFREEQHPWDTVPYTFENIQYHSERTQEPPLRPAPLLGEHTIEVAEEWLGMSHEEALTLVERGSLEAPPLPDKKEVLKL